MPFMTKTHAAKPHGGEFSGTVGHVFSAKDTQTQHLGGRQLWLKVRIKITTYGLRQNIDIARLHQVIYCDGLFSHRFKWLRAFAAGPQPLWLYEKWCGAAASDRRGLWHSRRRPPRLGSLQWPPDWHVLRRARAWCPSGR